MNELRYVLCKICENNYFLKKYENKTKIVVNYNDINS